MNGGDTINSYNINDQDFVNSDVFQKFLRDNPARGGLKIRAYAASQAVPVSGVKIVVSAIIDNNNVIFYEGYTDSSGVVDKIILPAPLLNSDNMFVPNRMTYNISASLESDNFKQEYVVNMYDRVCVVQNISIVPKMFNKGGFNGS